MLRTESQQWADRIIWSLDGNDPPAVLRTLLEQSAKAKKSIPVDLVRTVAVGYRAIEHFGIDGLRIHLIPREIRLYRDFRGCNGKQINQIIKDYGIDRQVPGWLLPFGRYTFLPVPDGGPKALFWDKDDLYVSTFRGTEEVQQAGYAGAVLNSHPDFIRRLRTHGRFSGLQIYANWSADDPKPPRLSEVLIPEIDGVVITDLRPGNINRVMTELAANLDPLEQ